MCFLKAQPLDPTISHHIGMTALHLAGMKGHGEACSTLVFGGAALDIKDNMNRTPLEIAEEYQQKQTSVYLKHIQEQKDAELADKTKRRNMMKKKLSAGHYYVWGQYLCNIYCHYVIFFVLLPNYPSSFFLYSGIFLYIVENYCYFKASRSDPGFLPSQVCLLQAGIHQIVYHHYRDIVKRQRLHHFQ